MNISKLRITNMQSPRSGNPVANQFIILNDDGQYFKSYQTMIAFRPNQGNIVLDSNSWDYSKTTLKYLKEFLGINSSKKEIQKAIDNKAYLTANLN